MFYFHFVSLQRLRTQWKTRPEIIRSSNNTFRGAKTWPFCVDPKLPRCSGVKRSIIRRESGVSLSDASQCHRVPCNLSGRRHVMFRQFGTGDNRIPICLRILKEKEKRIRRMLHKRGRKRIWAMNNDGSVRSKLDFDVCDGDSGVVGSTLFWSPE